MYLIVQIKKKAFPNFYNMEEVINHILRDSDGFDRFDEQWGHSEIILEALENDLIIQFALI